QDWQKDNDELETQISNLNVQMEQARQSLNEYEELRRAGRPSLEARLGRLHSLSKRLTALHQAEEKYTLRVMRQGLAEGNAVQLVKVRKDVEEKEHELLGAKTEADALENQWRQISIGHQLVEWQRLKGLSQGQEEAGQQVIAAHQQQERLTNVALETRRTANRWLIFSIGGGALGIVLGIVALFIASQQAILASVLGLLVLALFGHAPYSL